MTYGKERLIMYRVWYSTESFADFIIDHTLLAGLPHIKNKLYESDANNPNRFHTMPDHIRKILYLDAPDAIIEKDNEPVFSIEVTTEAGTGHNAFQRFARVAAAVENSVPAFYIYPEGKIVTRTSNGSKKYDEINPLVFTAMESLMSLYGIPALLYYFPTDNISLYRNRVLDSPHLSTSGLIYDPRITQYSGCPDAASPSMNAMFNAINEIIQDTERLGVLPARSGLLRNLVLRNQRNYMQSQFTIKANGKPYTDMSPLSAVKTVPTNYVMNYLSQYENKTYQIGELLRNRPTTCLYQVDAHFRGDPYPGCLAAIDYLICRQGLTFEERRSNLIMVWGLVDVHHNTQSITITDNRGSSVNDFFEDVRGCSRHNLLTRYYKQLSNKEKPRYFMQVRYGSTYSKVKHIRVYSYFADAILFPDGSLWRDA